MEMSRPDIYPKGLVYIVTYNNIFDCIGTIESYHKGEYQKDKDKYIDYYTVNVKKYIGFDFSNKIVKYYVHEIEKIVAKKLNKETIGILYARD